MIIIHCSHGKCHVIDVKHSVSVNCCFSLSPVENMKSYVCTIKSDHLWLINVSSMLHQPRVYLTLAWEFTFIGQIPKVKIMAASSSSSSIDSILSKLAALQESVDCVICRGRLQRPVVTVCGHTFCGRCVDKTFEAAASTTGGRRGGGGRGKGTSCPLCVTPLHKRSICETERTRSIVEAIQKVADVAKATLKVDGGGIQLAPDATMYSLRI